MSAYGQEVEVKETVETVEINVYNNELEPTFTFEIPPEYQTELPQDKAKLAPKPRKQRDPWFSLGFLGPLFQLIFYGILALAVIYILYLILSAVVIAKRSHVRADDAEDVPDTPVYQPDAETARVLIDDADGLAAQGKFAEAVHILLFRSIQDIEDKRPHHVKRSLTSREISRLSILSPKARNVFSQIGKLVENSFFGGRPLGAEDYELSKAAYKAFAFENVAATKTARSARARR
ncbi:MAG: hypothetical protein L3J05_01880 [Robiginitomaculum sp.]|nr:hypothetical protein [Robiginitomaculum sp.]